VGTENRSTFTAPRRALPEEAGTIADLWLRSRYASIPAIPAPVHTDEEAREWFASVVIPDRDIWVIARDDLPVALLVLDDGWVDQLYVDPQWTGDGLGSVLIRLAKELRPERLELWTFQSNVAARRFYERHGSSPSTRPTARTKSALLTFTTAGQVPDCHSACAGSGNISFRSVTCNRQ
jgi:GNAT superfamily N-acetyltransferase